MARFARRLQRIPGGIRIDPGDVLATLITSNPPSGTSPAPSGPLAGTAGQFDAATLATNEIWDNFNGTTLDSRLWQRDTINQGGTQVYQDANMYLDGTGNAVMECTRVNGTIYSGRFTSRQKFAMQYGWFAARIKLPRSIGSVGRAWFPAWWLLLVDYNNSPYYSEIDMIEQFGNSATYSTHVYFGSGNPNFESYVDAPASHNNDASQAYHTYWMRREENRIRVGVDQVMLGDWGPSDIGTTLWNQHMKQPMYYITNFAAAPSFLPAPQASDFPAKMLVDWIWYKPL